MGEEFKTMIIGNSGLGGEKVKTWLLDLGIYHILRQWEPTHLKKTVKDTSLYNAKLGVTDNIWYRRHEQVITWVGSHGHGDLY